MSALETGIKSQIIDAFNGDVNLELSHIDLAEKIGGTTPGVVRQWCRTMSEKGELEGVVKSGEILKYRLGPRNGAPKRAIGSVGQSTAAPAHPSTAGVGFPTTPLTRPDAVRTNGKLDMSKLLEDAEEEADRSIGRYAEVMPVVHKLRTKELTWKEIEQWFKARGVEVTYSGLMNTYKEWLKTGPGQGLPS